MMLKTRMWGWRLAVGGLVLLLAGCAGTAGMEGVVALLPTGQWPEDVVFDPETQTIFVADEGSATVTTMSATPLDTLFGR
jgi:hypothetical protein